MKQCKGVLSGLIVIAAAVCLGLGAGVGAMANAAEGEFACAQEGKISKEISPEAELAGLSCFFKKYEGAQVLHFKVAVKNVSDKPQRFRVHIFLDNGKAVGGLIPEKTKKGLVNPGQVGTFVYPVTGMTDKPGSVSLKIARMGE
ncbi:MAG: hypothetical protein KJ573_00110 [Proteobacteria bacterium]|nr:hypothetical protein [Desulfobacterales bacterium]MBL7171226.1 hypothetical protein [Desulfobacteraceae bacterium]MBU1901976.1 hypothetical protein [Pseudomonadota bacterium]